MQVWILLSKKDELIEKEHIGKGDVIIAKKGQNVSIDVKGPDEVIKQADKIRQITRTRELFER